MKLLVQNRDTLWGEVNKITLVDLSDKTKKVINTQSCTLNCDELLKDFEEDEIFELNISDELIEDLLKLETASITLDFRAREVTKYVTITVISEQVGMRVMYNANLNLQPVEDSLVESIDEFLNILNKY